MTESSILQAKHLAVERRAVTILEDISLNVEPDTSLLIQGPSGSGKTTLFHVLALLAAPTSGRLEVDGVDVADMTDRKRARVRRETVGIVFQDFQLIPDLTAWENAAVPQVHASDRNEAWLTELFETMGIKSLKNRYPATLSGGEKQRVAIARALANKPAVVLADEPTGQLDPDTAETVLELLFTLRQTTETALVVVSHDRELESRFNDVAYLHEGQLKEKRKSSLASSEIPILNEQQREQ